MAHDVNQDETDVAALVRTALIEKITAERYDLWISTNTVWSWDSVALRLSFASEFACQIAKKMIGSDLLNVTRQVVGFDCEVEFQHDAAVAEATAARSALADEQALLAASGANQPRPSGDARTTANAATNRKASPTTTEFRITDRSQATSMPGGNLWRSVVRGASNELACTTATLTINEPGRLTPVFFYGPTGCGKSLLASAVAQQLRTTQRMRRVVHMTSEQFTNDFMEGLRGGGLPMFRRKYRDVEALVLDDVQFFAGKKSTLAEVKHTLDNLLTQKKQVICTADRSLNELGGLGPEIVGRLRGGLVSPIFPLDAGMRAEMLSQQLAAEGVSVEEGVVEQLAERCAGDGRIVGGIAKRLTATASLSGNRLSWNESWNAVFDLVQATQPVVRIGDIERVVCSVFGLEPDSLQSSSKMRSVSQPRMLAMFLARKYTPAAYKEIGEYFGRRRHSTVISAEKTVEGWLAETSQVSCSRGMNVRDALRHVESQLQIG